MGDPRIDVCINDDIDIVQVSDTIDGRRRVTLGLLEPPRSTLQLDIDEKDPSLKQLLEIQQMKEGILQQNISNQLFQLLPRKKVSESESEREDDDAEKKSEIAQRYDQMSKIFRSVDDTLSDDEYLDALEQSFGSSGPRPEQSRPDKLSWSSRSERKAHCMLFYLAATSETGIQGGGSMWERAKTAIVGFVTRFFNEYLPTWSSMGEKITKFFSLSGGGMVSDFLSSILSGLRTYFYGSSSDDESSASTGASSASTGASSASTGASSASDEESSSSGWAATFAKFVGAFMVFLLTGMSLPGAATLTLIGYVFQKFILTWLGDTLIDTDDDGTQSVNQNNALRVTAIGSAVLTPLVLFVKTNLIYTATQDPSGQTWAYSFNYIASLGSFITSVFTAPWFAVSQVPIVGSIASGIGTAIGTFFQYCIFSWGVIVAGPLLLIGFVKYRSVLNNNKTTKKKELSRLDTAILHTGTLVRYMLLFPLELLRRLLELLTK